MTRAPKRPRKYVRGLEVDTGLVHLVYEYAISWVSPHQDSWYVANRKLRLTKNPLTCLECMAFNGDALSVDRQVYELLTGKSPSAQLEKRAKELHAMAEEQYKEEFRKRVARTIARRIADSCFIKPSFDKQSRWEEIVLEELTKDNERY